MVAFRGIDPEGHQPVFIDAPGRVPRNFPGVVVGIGDIAAKAAMRGRVGSAQQRPACLCQPLHQRRDICLLLHIMGERKCPRLHKAATVHVGFER